MPSTKKAAKKKRKQRRAAAAAGAAAANPQGGVNARRNRGTVRQERHRAVNDFKNTLASMYPRLLGADAAHRDIMVFDPNLRQCATCGKQKPNKSKSQEGGGAASVNMYKCSRCEAVAYCSVECQQADAKHHKEICRRTAHVTQGRHQHTTFKQCMGTIGVDFHAWHVVNGNIYDLASALGIPKLPDGDRRYDEHLTCRKKFKTPGLANELYAWSFEKWQNYCARKKYTDWMHDVGVHLPSNTRKEAYDAYAQAHPDDAACLSDPSSVLGDPVVWKRPHVRVFALMHFFPDIFTKETLRFGSLGYRHEDGSIFWEYG